jgi:ferredoxin
MIHHINNLNRGALLSEVLQSTDINFELPCSKGTCGKCKVKIIEGKLSEICNQAEVLYINPRRI